MTTTFTATTANRMRAGAAMSTYRVASFASHAAYPALAAVANSWADVNVATPGAAIAVAQANLSAKRICTKATTRPYGRGGPPTG